MVSDRFLLHFLWSQNENQLFVKSAKQSSCIVYGCNRYDFEMGHFTPNGSLSLTIKKLFL